MGEGIVRRNGNDDVGKHHKKRLVALAKGGWGLGEGLLLLLLAITNAHAHQAAIFVWRHSTTTKTTKTLTKFLLIPLSVALFPSLFLYRALFRSCCVWSVENRRRKTSENSWSANVVEKKL